MCVAGSVARDELRVDRLDERDTATARNAGTAQRKLQQRRPRAAGAAPGASTSVGVTAQNAFLGLATISASGQLSRPTVTNSVQITNPIGQATFTIQYTVTSGNPYDGCAQTSTIVDPSGVVSMSPTSSRGFSVNVPVPNCPGTTLYTVTTNVLSFESAPKVLGTVTTQFETSDLASKPHVVAGSIPFEIAGIQTFNATFVPDPAATGVVAIGPTTFVFDGFGEALKGELSVPGLGDNTLVGSFVRGQFFSFSAPAGNGSCAAPITCNVGMGGGVGYFVGLNAPLPANPTGQLLGPGDTIDLYPIAGTIAFGFNPVVTQPITITGPKLGSVTISP